MTPALPAARLDLRRFAGRVRRRLRALRAGALRSARRRRALPAAGPSPRGPVARPAVSALVVGSTRIRAGLAPEWQQDEPGPDGWRETVATRRPAVVLVEATTVPGWVEADGRGTVEPTDALRDLLAWCADADVPSVLWVTAPGSAPVAATAGLAALARHVATVDPRTVAAWRQHLGHDRVVALGPAAQPRVSHPGRSGPTTPSARRPYDVALVLDAPGDADPSGPVASLLGPALTVGGDVWTSTEPGSPRVPPGLRRRALPPLPYSRLARVPAAAKVALDAGPPGWQVPAWRVVEAGAAQAPVVTTPPGPALDAAIAAALTTADDPVTLRRRTAAHVAHPELRDRAGLRLHRAVHDGHTYGHRVDALLAALGTPAPAAAPTISAVVPTNRAHQLDHVLANAARQSHRELELVLVLHGLDVDPADVSRRAKDAGIDDVQVLQVDASRTLGTCLDIGVQAAGGRYLAKMDDDNHYGAHYLRDLVRAFTWTDAGIVGKWAHYVWLEASGTVVLRYPDAEHAYCRLVQGGSMLIAGDVARELRFADLPRAVDTDFLTRAAAAGVRTYASDRFNYVSVRRSSPDGHTWKVTDEEILTGSARVAFFGDPRAHVDA